VSATPTPAPTNSPIESGPESPWQTPPVIAFGGDCNNLFSDAQIAEYMGVPVAKHIENRSDAGNSWLDSAVVRHNGGLLCSWNDDSGEIDPGSHPYVRMVAMGASAYPEATSYLDCPDEINGCDFMQGAGGYLIAGSIALNESEYSTMKLSEVAQTIVDGIARDFPAAAGAAGTPSAPWTQRTGDWSSEVDCTALFKKSGAWDDLGIPAMKFYDGQSDGRQSWIEDSLTEGHGLSMCGAGDYGSIVGAQILSGGAWLEDEVSKIKGAKDVTIAGADRAIEWSISTSEGKFSSLYVFSGSNVLNFGSYIGGAADRKAAAAILAELNKGTTDATSAAYITTAGYGDVTLGQPVPEGISGVTWIPEMMPGCTPDSSWFIESGGYVYTEQPGSDNHMLERGAVTEIYVYSPDIQTKSGAHIGMTVAELRNILPSVTKDSASGAWVVADDLGEVIFYPHSGNDQSPIESIRVLRAGVAPGDFVPANTCD